MFELKKMVILDEQCFESLRVFDSPYSNKKNPKSSLYRLLNRTNTQIGNCTLYKFLLRPSQEVDVIRNRLNMVETIIKEIEGSTTSSIETIVESLKSIPNIENCLSKLEKGNNRGKFVWKSIRSFLLNTKRIINTISISPVLSECEIFQSLVLSFPIEKVVDVCKYVEDILDFEIDINDVTIRQGVCTELDENRRIYSILEEILEQSTLQLTSQINDDRIARSISTVYIQQLGYLIAVDFSLIEDYEVFQQNPGLQDLNEVFRSSTCVCYKNQEMMAMDENFGDIYSIIRDMEIEIYYHLSQEILKYRNMIIKFYQNIGVVDTMISFASVAFEYHFCKPKIVTDSTIDLKNCINPLLDKPISNEISVDPTQNSNITVITGPNYSGKSSLLRQCGISVFLAHIGSFVPAEEATIGLTDKILTRINSLETVGKTESTFLIDSRQMAKCLALSTSKSLILVDEFGKGTDAIDGPALLAACICHLSSLKEKSPRTFVVTHFFELFNTDAIKFPFKINYSHMKTKITRDEKNHNKITYLYKLVQGISDDSFGIHCARNCGIPESVITRAQAIMKCLVSGESLSKSIGNSTEDDVKNYKIAENAIQKFLAIDLDSASIAQIKDKLSDF